MYYHDIGVLFPYPGTEVYQIAVGKHDISDDYWLTDKEVPFFTAEHSKEELMLMKKYVLDRISLKHFVTWDGFVPQIKMLPYILRDKVHRKMLRRFVKQKLRGQDVHD
jgi:hypothetical protein